MATLFEQAVLEKERRALIAQATNEKLSREHEKSLTALVEDSIGQEALVAGISLEEIKRGVTVEGVRGVPIEPEFVEIQKTTVPRRQFRNSIDEFVRAIGRGTLNVGSGLLSTFADVGQDSIFDIQRIDELAEKARETSQKPKFQPATDGGIKGFIANAVGDALPFMAGTIAATIIGGPTAGFGVAYSVEGKNAYFDALDTGATQKQAEIEGFVVGSINAALELLQVERVLKFAKVGKGSVKSIIKSAKDKTFKKLLKSVGKLSKETIKTSITEGIQESLQETTSVLAPGLTGRELPTIKEAGKRISQAALGGAVAGPILGGAGAISQAVAKEPTAAKLAPERPVKPTKPKRGVIVPPKPKEPQIKPQAVEGKFKKAGNVVDGLKVRAEVPNTSSIEATFGSDFTELSGIREVPLSVFEAPPDINEKTKALAEDIKESGEINPLIVAIDKDGPYILEGANRFDAMKILGAKSIPAVVVTDDASLRQAKPPVTEPQKQVEKPRIRVQAKLEIRPIEQTTTEKTPEIQAKVSETVETDFTKATSAKQASLAEDRKSMGLDEINSKSRRSWETALRQAKTEKIASKANRIAEEVNATPRALSDVETAGVTIRMAELKNEHKQAMAEIEKSKDKADIKTRSTEINRIEAEFDALSKAVNTSGTEKGRALASQKLTINKDFSLISVLNRAKAAAGKKLTAVQNKIFKGLTQRLDKTVKRVESLETEVNELKAKGFVRRGVSRFRTMTTTQRATNLDSLVERTNNLLQEGCNN